MTSWNKLMIIFCKRPWPCPNDFDTQTRPTCGKTFLCEGVQSYSLNRQTDATENITYLHTQVTIRSQGLMVHVRYLSRPHRIDWSRPPPEPQHPSNLDTLAWHPPSVLSQSETKLGLRLGWVPRLEGCQRVLRPTCALSVISRGWSSDLGTPPLL